MSSSLLVELRQASGLTQEELAERTGLSARSIGDLERGTTRRPRRASLEALATALGLAGERRAAFIAQYRFSSGSTRPADGSVPAELPAGTSGFVGREAELERLDALHRSGTRVVVVEGGAGMGKTELALRWAHRARADFPDGQLFAGLHGFGASPPTAPGIVLEQFLRSLGVAAHEVPDGLDARSALLRTRLADRRMLLVLDDATDSSQVRPLLPGTASCATIVTSRRRLEALRTRAGAARLELGELPAADAAKVFDELVGSDRVDDVERRAALALCRGMPLALRLISGRLTGAVASAPALDLMVAADDPSVGVRDLLSWSVRCLGADARSLFAALGLLPLPEVHVCVASAVIGWELPRTRAACAELASVHLAEPRRHDRYELHDLVHEYAREQAAELPEDACDRAVTRVEMLFVAAADEASRQLGMSSDHQGADGVPAPELGTDDVQQWLRDQRPMLIAVARQAGERGAHATVRRLSDAWWRLLYKDMRDEDARILHGIALRSAELTGDRVARCRALQYLGVIDTRAGRVDDARRRLDEAVEIAADLDRPSEEAEATGLLASMYAGIGDYPAAIRWAHRTLELVRRAGNDESEASLLNNLGMLHRKVGDLAAAAEVLHEALDLAVATTDTDAESAALNNLGTLYREQGDLSAARASLEAALDAARRACNAEGEGIVLTKLADVLCELGEPDAAEVQLDAAASISAESATPHLRNLVHNARGGWARAVGDLDTAETEYRAVLDPDDGAHDRPELARAHAGLGRVARARGDLASAREQLRLAVEEHRRLGSPHAETLEAELHDLDGQGRPARFD